MRSSSLFLSTLATAGVLGLVSACAFIPGGDDHERHHMQDAGTHVVVPEGWVTDTEDLIFGELSVMPDPGEGEDPVAIVLVGRFDGLFDTPDQAASLPDVARANAASFGEFLFPEPGERTTVLDEEREVDGEPAHIVESEINQEGTLSYSRFLVVDRASADPVFAAFLHQDASEEMVEQGNSVLDLLTFD